jgi:molecular chaperone Hsp33
MDAVHRFLLEDLDIRGALVQLGPSWAEMTATRGYAAPVRTLLGELAAVTALIGSNLKAPGRIGFQMSGHGPVSMLVMDCNEKLQLRGMARSILSDEAPAHVAGVTGLLGDGQLVLTLQSKDAETPYQSVVPLTGDSVAAVFEHYLEQSEQQPSRLWLMATPDAACGLFLQKLPNADVLDPDGWDRRHGQARRAAAAARDPADAPVSRRERAPLPAAPGRMALPARRGKGAQHAAVAGPRGNRIHARRCRDHRRRG